MGRRVGDDFVALVIAALLTVFLLAREDEGLFAGERGAIPGYLGGREGGAEGAGEVAEGAVHVLAVESRQLHWFTPHPRRLPIRWGEAGSLAVLGRSPSPQ